MDLQKWQDETYFSAGLTMCTAKILQVSSLKAWFQRLRLRRQGLPNPTFEPFKNTSTRASAAQAKWRNTIQRGVPGRLRTPVGHASETAKPHAASFKPNGVVSEAPAATPRSALPEAARCMRNTETPAGFKPKRWPKKVPNATPRCA